MKYFSLAILCLLLVTPLLSKAQQVSNIHFEQVGKQIHIYYDLQGNSTYNVKVFCSTDDGQTWGNPLQKVTGAVGENRQSGNNKEIIWDVLAEREKLTGEISFKVETTNLFGIEMVFVKGGTFQMGNNDGESIEQPMHTVTLADFYIGKYEVTQKQWREIMGNNPSSFSRCDNCPVESVSWNDIQEFIKRLNEKTGLHYRLPTEAEWEYAARGGNQSNGYKYAGSNNIDKVAWYDGSRVGQAQEVGAKAPNELGIYDMSGNVWEWCNEWFDASYYSISPESSPQGPASGTSRVMRGGSWIDLTNYCRTAVRLGGAPDNSTVNVGFRIVRQ